MKQIYDRHHEQFQDESIFQRELIDFDDTSELKQQVSSEVNSTFPTLKNPMLIMYVFPHVATEDHIPIPGYWTAVPMYERAEFALPGEQESRSAED